MNLLQYVKVHGETTLRSPGGGKRKGRFKDRPLICSVRSIWCIGMCCFESGADLGDMINERKPVIPGNHGCM